MRILCSYWPLYLVLALLAFLAYPNAHASDLWTQNVHLSGKNGTAVGTAMGKEKSEVRARAFIEAQKTLLRVCVKLNDCPGHSIAVQETHSQCSAARGSFTCQSMAHFTIGGPSQPGEVSYNTSDLQ